MKQIVQNLRSGVLELLEVPTPRASSGHILVRTRASLISAGTERMLVEFGKASLIDKARKNPDRVKQVLDKIKTDGLMPTLEAVFDKLDEPLPLGYCSAGEIVEVGAGVTNYAVGDRVASNGGHAEFARVPLNLSAKIPDNVSDEEASFAVLGAIALQGIRLLKPQLGESVAVFGLGLVGLLTVQMLVADGARVIGIDLNPERLKLAEQFGATPLNPAEGTDVVKAAMAFSGGHGVDGVLITASAKNDSIVEQAAQMSRKRGSIVLVGVVNLNLNRADFYEKELKFQVSCSYGPGRYDVEYEDKGQDYPYPFVRWTEQRNIAAVLDMISLGRIDMKPLISHRFAHSDAVKAYELLSSGESQMGVVLEYPSDEPSRQRTIVRSEPNIANRKTEPTQAAIGIIGAGNFTKRTILPALKKNGVTLKSIASGGGVSAAHAARKFDIDSYTTDYRSMLDDESINTVFITTRHDMHAPMVVDALTAGKHVFVEKPLAIDRNGLQQVKQAYEATGGKQQLMVGFNRRFAPQVESVKRQLKGRTQPLCMTMNVNAGFIPADHWLQDPTTGGGRIIGEVCHWIDLLRCLAQSPITRTTSMCVGDVPSVQVRNDMVTVTCGYEDGSLGTIHYFSNGHRGYPKEQLTVYSDGRVLHLDNFRKLTAHGARIPRSEKSGRQDKGHQNEIDQFVARINSGGPPLIPFDELYEVSLATIDANDQALSPNVAPTTGQIEAPATEEEFAS